MSAVDDYLLGLEAPERAELERVRNIVKTTVPEAVESIGYGMPAFKYKGKPLFYYAAFTNHLSVFPTSGPTEELKDKLVGYKVSKGTVQFTLDKPLPESLIIDMLQSRLADINK